MVFDSTSEAMQKNGQIWFPCDYARIRWWATEGRTAVVRPGVSPDRSKELGLDRDVFWAYVGHLDKTRIDRLFAEWVVGRPDLGIAVTASKLEVAVTGYYDLLSSTDVGTGRPLGDSMSEGEMRAVRDQFSSRSPTFCILSGTDRAPFIYDTPDELSSSADTCENIGPMKRSVYSRV